MSEAAPSSVPHESAAPGPWIQNARFDLLFLHSVAAHCAARADHLAQPQHALPGVRLRAGGSALPVYAHVLLLGRHTRAASLPLDVVLRGAGADRGVDRGRHPLQCAVHRSAGRVRVEHRTRRAAELRHPVDLSASCRREGPRDQADRERRDSMDRCRPRVLGHEWISDAAPVHDEVVGPASLCRVAGRDARCDRGARAIGCFACATLSEPTPAAASGAGHAREQPAAVPSLPVDSRHESGHARRAVGTLPPVPGHRVARAPSQVRRRGRPGAIAAVARAVEHEPAASRHGVVHYGRRLAGVARLCRPLRSRRCTPRCCSRSPSCTSTWMACSGHSSVPKCARVWGLTSWECDPAAR